MTIMFRYYLPECKVRATLVAMLLLAAIFQVLVSFLQHESVGDSASSASVKEELFISPDRLVEWSGSSKKSGVDLKPMMEFLNKTAGVPGPAYGNHQPDDLYILLNTGSSISFELSMNTYWKHPVSFRRRELTDGLNFLESTIEERFKNNKSSWPLLASTLENNSSSFPILINWDRSDNCTGDAEYYCCNRPFDPSGTIRMSGNVPIMRFISPWDCKYRLLIPTGDVLKLATKDASEWAQKFKIQDDQFPWDKKIPRVVHRGPINIHPEATQQKILQTLGESTLFENVEYKPNENYDLTNFQNYTAALDIHTLFYPQLLCQNSVVLKWDPPQCLDALWLATGLEAWKHYIPVHNVTHMVDLAHFVTNSKNQDALKKIVQNAHQWCQDNLVYSHLQDTLLSTITSYIGLLVKYDSLWQTDVWRKTRDDYLTGHWFLRRDHAYTLPKPTVGSIKTGKRRDDPRYNTTTKEFQ